MPSILDGITILDLSTGPAAALATMLLSDQGARVIRVTGPDAPLFRDGGFIIWDRGKECVALDLDQATGETPQAVRLRELMAGADILVEDFAPSSPRQDLVAPERLEEINPRLISCSVTAYGKRGALKDEPAIEDLVLARMGVLGGLPGFRPAPVHLVHPLPTVGASILACLGIAAALLARETSGRGRTVETSLMAGALLYHPKVIGEHLDRHVFQTHPSGSAPFYSVYECADGNWVQLGCVHVGFIATAAKLMGIGDLVAEPRFNGGGAPATPEDDAELRAVLTEVIGGKPLAEWVEAFEAADVPFAPARQTEDGITDPQVIHNEMVATLDDPELGPVVQMGVPLVFSETPGEVKGPRAAAESNGGVAPDANGAAAPAQGAPDPLPLDGIRILEITNLIAGPTGGRLLADLGADVIKFEPLGGDLSRPIGRTYFYNLNFNKRSVSVNTSTDEGKEAVQRIAASCDALLANLRPGATERMGIGPANNPQLIETHLTGYGRTGPYAHRPGIDPLAQAMMGMSWAQGGPENQPVFPAQLAPTDYTTGALGALGTVLAIYGRTRHGTVQRVDSNLLNGAVLLSSAWFSRYRGRPERPLADKDQYGLNPFHRLFRLADGWVYVAAETETQRRALCRVAGQAEQTEAGGGDDGSHPNRTALAKALAAAFAERGLVELRAELQEAGVPSAEAQTGDSELYLDDPHTLANGMAATVQHPTAGALSVACQYIHLGNTQTCAWRPTPLLGENTDEALREVGYGEAEIQALHEAGIVKTETA